MRILTPVLIFIIADLFVGCTSSVHTQEPDAVNLVVDAEALSRMLDNPNVVVLHVARDRAHYDEGHVPGARYLPLSAVVADRDGYANMLPPAEALGEALRISGVSNNSRVVVYGDLDGLAAARTFFALDVAGHMSVAILDGGLSAWRTSGGSVVTDPTPTPEPGTFVPRLRVDRIVTAEEIAEDLTSVVLIDARPQDQYTGETPGRDVRRPGHIPGAASHFWQEDLFPDGTFLPLAELRARYAAHGAIPGREVVTYCRTGMQASHTYFVARLLGFDIALYDRSFLDWSNNTDYTVEFSP